MTTLCGIEKRNGKRKNGSTLLRWTACAASHTSHKQIRELMTGYIGDHEHLLTIVKRRQLIWVGHVIRWKGSLANTLLHEDTDCCRKGGRPVRMWLDNNKDWNGLNFHQLIRTAENRELRSSCVSSAIKMSPHGLQAMGHRLKMAKTMKHWIRNCTSYCNMVVFL